MDDRILRWVDTASGPAIPVEEPPTATVCRSCQDGVHEQCDGTEPLRAPERGYLAPALADLVCRCHGRGHEPETQR